ncbi:hypothetical protein [Sphingomonas arenae]|uniref:hypothetical protein n=1 Tax=Sphingomonas arenae TaxID=2812555 RepID=UPI0019681F64|nr:hypothetical protein [Sphingomonas arenae]
MAKFKITPIGTCRIHNVLRSAAAKYPVEMHVPRTYGYTHTSLEALQQLAFLEGRVDFPDHLVPVIFRGETRPEELTDPWHGADLVMVELSSLKLIEAEGYALQTRYLSTHFSDFFGSPGRNRTYWQLAERDRAGLHAFLETDEAFHRLPEMQQQLLKSISLRQQSFDELRKDVEELVERIGPDRILFVTHVNALDPNGKRLAARDKMVRWVEQAAHELDAPCFNPTDVMLAFGQERAMERQGLDTTHYTEAFHGTLYAHLHQHYLAPRAQRVLGSDAALNGEVQLQMLADTISATIDQVDLVGGARQLHAALRSHPNAGALVEVRGRFREKVGDHEGALEDLSPLHAQGQLGTGGREALMRSLFEMGRPEQALSIALSLLHEEHETESVRLVAASASEQLGRIDDALAQWKALWRLDRTNLDAAMKAMTLASQAGSSSEPEWREELGYFSRRDARLAKALTRHALSTSDGPLFADAVTALAAAEPGTAADLLLQADACGMAVPASKAVGLILERTDLPTRTVRALRDLARAWGEAAIAAAEEHRFEEAARLATASAEALGSHSGASKALRTVGALMLPVARELAAAGRPEEVLVLLDDKRPVVLSRPRLALELLRAQIALERADDARALALEATALFPDDMVLALAAARHLKTSDLAEAALLYGRVGEADAEGRHAAEVARFRAAAASEAPQHIRAAVEQLNFRTAFGLLSMLSEEPAAAERERAEIIEAMRRFLSQSAADRSGSQVAETRELLLQLVPTDPVALAQAATTAMERHDYPEALSYWERLAEADPSSTEARNGMVRCRLLLGEPASEARVAAGS